MVNKRNHLIYNFSVTIHFHFTNFYAHNIKKKKLARKNAHWTKYWIWIEGSWALWPIMYSYNGLILRWNKNLEGKSSSGLFRREVRIWKRGGGFFWKSETIASDLDPNFHCSWIRFKRFIWNWDGFFGRNRKSRQLLHNFVTKSLRGGREAEIGLKSTKNVQFCILFRQWGARAPPGYATRIIICYHNIARGNVLYLPLSGPNKSLTIKIQQQICKIFHVFWT